MFIFNSPLLILPKSKMSLIMYKRREEFFFIIERNSNYCSSVEISSKNFTI